jgi:[protein-PII] uridylyltransferase
LLDNALSQQFTVIEVAGLDRPGLLFELTNTLSDLNLDITSAHITTFGEKVVDVFYVTDLTNKKITSPQRQKAIRQRLLEVLAERRASDALRAPASSDERASAAASLDVGKLSRQQ